MLPTCFWLLSSLKTMPTGRRARFRLLAMLCMLAGALCVAAPTGAAWDATVEPSKLGRFVGYAYLKRGYTDSAAAATALATGYEPVGEGEPA